MIAIETKIFKGKVGKIYKKIGFAERFPVFADYNTLQSQPKWWLDTLDDYYTASRDVKEANTPKDK